MMRSEGEKATVVPRNASSPRPDTAQDAPARPRRHVLRSLGLGLITGAADDDPSAIGTYAAAGARMGPAALWIVPVTFPMMFAAVYLSGKLGQVAGKGLFGVIRDHYRRPLLYTALVGVLLGNVFEAAADLGGMAAALGLIVPVQFHILVAGIALIIVAFQVLGSYELIREVFRWLALVLLAYVGAAFLAKPELGEVLKGTFVPTLQFDRESLSLIVAMIGTSLSAYLYT
jgi:Mn2+/Fe2+ NRAMP family transporter